MPFVAWGKFTGYAGSPWRRICKRSKLSTLMDDVRYKLLDGYFEGNPPATVTILPDGERPDQTTLELMPWTDADMDLLLAVPLMGAFCEPVE